MAQSFSFSLAANNLDTKTLSQINEACTFSPKECLILLDQHLPKVTEKSHLWYDLLQNRFNALFDLQLMETLHEETKAWINTKAPFSFQLTIFIYYAKTSITYEGRDVASKYAQLAKEKLEQMQEAFPSPMRLVELANVQMQLEEFQKAYELLLSVEKKYRQSKDSHFMMELYGNLAHVTRQLELHQQSLDYWLKTVPWASKFNNKQQIGTVLYNLANAYSTLNQLDSAESYYIEAIAFAMAAEDYAKTSEAQFQLVNIKVAQEKYHDAKVTLEGINLDYLPLIHLNKLPELIELLNKHSD